MQKKDLRIVFLGTPEFAVESLDRIIAEGYNVVGVVTMPDKPAGRGHKLFHSPVKEFALAHSLPLLQPANLKDPNFIADLKALNGNLFVVIAFRMLPREVWQMPELGTFNLHASLLPRYRGAAPINWAIINGDTKTGVTTFFLRHEIDTGDIIRQEAVDILPSDNVGDVHDRLMHLGAELTLDTLSHILAGDLQPIPQSQLLKGQVPTPAPKIFKETCQIDFSKSALDTHNLVRGLSPYPGAWANLHDMLSPSISHITQLKIFTTDLIAEKENSNDTFQPGMVIIEGTKMKVTCGDGKMLEILEVQPSGKRRMKTADFLRGARLPSKICFIRENL